MNSVQEVFGEHADTWVTIKGFIYGAFVFLDIDINVIGLLSILMALDTVLGIFKAFTLGKKITFKKLMWGMITKFSILIVPMVLALTAKALSFDFTWFVKIVIDILVVAEAFSAITNVISIKEKKELENTDFITLILKRIRGGLKSMFVGLMDQIDPDNKDKNEE